MKIGVDLGGSHIGVGIVSQKGKIVIKKEEDLKILKNSNSNDIKKYLKDTIVHLIHESLRNVGAPMCVIEKIGIAIPGKIEDGIAKDLYNLGIKQLDLVNMLKEHYNCEIKIKNDAKCAGIAEKKYGALKKINDAVFLCLGTGIGGATFYNGKLLEPKRSSGSEYGHMIIKKEGLLCNCGNKGCFEKYASMSAFKNELRKLLNLDKNINSKEILDILLKEYNNDKINNYIDEYIDDLILGISNISNIIEPQMICIGGSFVYFEKILYARLIEKLNENKYNFNKPEIVLAKLGNDAGIIGATLI